ncbi:MAG TPA: PAS domain S-box protein [Planctomycetaceae bacterium]|nr:PAS domain S-box protein [Planctomycetaceae bacterium]
MARALIIAGTAAETLSRALLGAGLEVEVVSQPEWAEGRIDAARFDLVVTPGSEFARLIERCAEESAQRQTTEAALLDAEAMYRSFAEGLPIHLICKDRSGTFTFANGLFCRELGRTLHEIVGKNDFDFFTPELAEKYRADDRHVFETRRVLQTVEENRLPSGQKRYVEVLKAPVYNAVGDVTGVQIAFWDVTDRKRAEEELQESESRHRAILEAALDCIVTIDQQGHIIEFNPAAETTFGYRRADILGRDMLETLFPPATASRQREGLDHYRGEGELDSMLGRRLEQTMVRHGGEKFLAETCMQPVPLEGKTVFTLFLRDITDRKRAEEEINRKNRDLETLLYVTSHDLREPLRAIHNFAKLVNERYAAKLDERGQDFLRRVVRGAERLDRLLEDVLTLSRAQRSVEIAQNVPLAEVVADVLQQLESRIERTGANVAVAGDLPNLSADRRWVTQAVYNLVANALKFTNPGEAPDVTIAPYHPGPADLPGTGIVVADRGPGVPAGYADRIFQLFQRAVGREVEGTGAGLAIVRQIAERHGGSAWVRPREGGGAEFVVTFDGDAGLHGMA